MTELTVLMPCLNEAETIEGCIEMAKQGLTRSEIKGEILIADNGSTDGSQSIAEGLGVRVVSIPQKGYGSALWGGILAANGKYVIMGDCDGSYDFSNLDLFVDNLRSGHDLVMGNRFLGGIKPGAMPHLHRYLGNPILTSIGRILFKSKCKDFHCGLRGFNREAIIALDLRTSGMEFASEMVVKATLHKLNITEVPTILMPDGRSRPPHLRSWRDGWRHLRFLLMYSPRWLFFLPGLMSINLGIILGSAALIHAIAFNNFQFSTKWSFLACSFIIAGYQGLIFAVFTKTFALEEGLLPPDPVFQSFYKYINLEIGLLLGFLLAAVGFGLCCASVYHGHDNLKPLLNDSLTMSFFIGGITFLILGVQIIFSSFFLSILGLRRRQKTK
jgi:glycosyltransferase involved in cell wall biosynthesis